MISQAFARLPETCCEKLSCHFLPETHVLEYPATCAERITRRPHQDRNRHLCNFMNPTTRRVLQAVLYEVFAIAFVGPVLSLVFDEPASSTLVLAVVLSSIALAWNYIFNVLFERWESRQSMKGRSLVRRMAHGIGFEGGLTVLLIPVMSLWLKISILDALFANLGLLAFFFVYAITFTWAFDRAFGLPQSATKTP